MLTEGQPVYCCGFWFNLDLFIRKTVCSTLRKITYLGAVDVSAQPQQNGSKGQHFHEMTRFFLVPSSNAAKVFELAKHAFDDVTLFVQVPVAASLRLALGGITAVISRCPSQSSSALASYPLSAKSAPVQPMFFMRGILLTAYVNRA